MDLLVNDLSIHGQFHDLDSFHEALERLMEMRRVAKRFQRDIFYNDDFLIKNPIQNTQIQQAIHSFRDIDKRRAIMIWLNKGSFWNTQEQRKHSKNDSLKCINKNDQVVTNHAVGEAAFRELNGSSCGVISMKPSDWQFTPVQVVHRYDNEEIEDPRVDVENFFDPHELEICLQNAEPPISSWSDLQRVALARFDQLVFADACFEPLDPLPFQRCSAETLMNRLHVLNQLAPGWGGDGGWTAQQQQLHKNHFHGDNAHFSDSSKSETQKLKIRKKLTFPHPEHPGEKLFCPYHGKERHLTLRLHFWQPTELGEHVYVVYIGPKLTKK